METAEGSRALWDVPQLAKYLNRSPGETYRLIREGRIPGVVKLGPRSIRVDPQTITEWIHDGAPGAIDIEAARRYLAAKLPGGEQLEITDESILDAAVAIMAAWKAAP